MSKVSIVKKTRDFEKGGDGYQVDLETLRISRKIVHSGVMYVMLQTRELERDVKLQLKVVCHIFQVELNR